MQLRDILTMERTWCNVQVSSKKRVLELISERVANYSTNLNQNAIFDCLITRERLGSTSLGYGIAIPHARIADLNVAMGCLITLEKGVDFDAVDKIPVDLLFVLLVPQQATDEHLWFLAQLAELFSKPAVRDELRASLSVTELYNRFINYGK